MKPPPSNPFRFGPLALDESFTDREDEYEEILADCVNGQDVWVYAPRRYGKSSLIWKVMQGLQRRRALVAYVNLMTTPTKEKLAEKLAKSIHDDVTSRLERARERALAPFRGLRIAPTITIDPLDGSLSFSFTATTSSDVDATLERLLELPAELAAERKRRVVLVMDEFQEILDIDRNLPKLLRTVFEQQPEVAHVYLGSKRSLMEGIFNDANEPFWRSAKQFELGAIDVAVFAKFIHERFASSGKAISAEAVERILGLTAGQPYATQELSYFVWEATPPTAEAGDDELAAGLEATLRSENINFSRHWDEASRVQRVILEALVKQPGRPFTKEYRARHRLPAATNVQKALAALVKKELVESDAGHYRVIEPFFDEWIRRQIENG